MDNFYEIQSPGEETPEDNYRPSLPARFQITGWLRLDEKLWLYDVFDRFVDQPARLWLEEITLQTEVYQSRAISLQKLSHGNLLPIYNHFMWGENGKNYYVNVAKVPDRKYVNSRMLIASSPNVIVVGQIVRQIALALMYCHSQKVLHGNLQPSFIWIGQDGTVRLELFGALPNRRHALKNSTSNSFSNPLSNAPYTSPEQFGSNAPFNMQTDVYALGVIIYEMLAGFNPFLATSEVISGLRHMYKAVPPLHQINPEVGSSLEAAIMTALVKNPEGRYHNVLELLSHFEIGLANTLQTSKEPVKFQTIEQLLENYTQLNNEVQSFLKKSAPQLKETNLPSQQQRELELLKVEPEPVPVQNTAVADLKPVKNNVIIEPEPAKEAESVPVEKPAQPASVPKQLPLKAGGLKNQPLIVTRATARKPQIVGNRQATKWSNLIPWLLVFNLFFMGYLAWLLINSANSSGSGLPANLPAYPTNPARAFFTPVPGNTPIPGPKVTQQISPITPASDFTGPATVSPATALPTTSPDVIDPRVLTALAPTVTSSFDLGEPVTTIELVPDDTPTPTNTPGNPG